MRKEYDLNVLKVKHRGILKGSNSQSPAKVRVTLSLDTKIIEYFKL